MMNLRKILALVLSCVMLLSLAACAGKTEETVPATTQETTLPQETEAAPETTAPEVTIPQAAPDVAIETPYATMYFPGDWAGFLVTDAVEGETYTVNFVCQLESGREQPVFSVSFGDVEEPIGSVKTSDEKNANVGVETVEFAPDDSWTDSEINIVYNMISCLNRVLESLDLQEAVEEEVPEQTKATEPSKPQGGSSETLPPEMQNDMALDTPYGELHYPSYWADSLSIRVDESNGYSVGFYCKTESHDPVHMFTIHFGGTQGAVVTTILDQNGGSVEVRVSMSELSLDDSWNDEDRAIAFAMQEDLNYLLGYIN